MEPGPTSGSQLNRLLSGGDASQILKEMLNVGNSRSPSNSNNGVGASPQTESSSQASRSDPAVMNATPSQSAKSLLPDATAMEDMISLDKKVAQSIVLEGDDRGGSVPMYGREVDITPSRASCVESSIPGSSKVKITPVVNYEWEAKYYFGNLVAVNDTFLVYVLRIQSGYGLRILNRRSTVRALLKGFSCVIIDIAFAFHNADILGCVDQRGNLSVWHIKEEGGVISYEPKIQVKRSLPPSDYHRIVWCPYLPDDDLSNEWSNLLAVSHGERAELWDITAVAGELGTSEIKYEQVSNGLIAINGHTKAITDMAVSPDGSVLASASLDGTVRFWQMYWEVSEEPPRCLHQFAPHDGEPVMSLLFCDNHKQQDASLPFWRFLITGADQNRELKVWCTVQWICLQKIRFGSSPNDIQPCLKVKLDLSASFLMATDIRRKVLYVIQLYQQHDDGTAHFSSVTEFLLMQPMLSFAIVDAGRCRTKQTQEEAEDGEELQTGEFEEVAAEGEDGDNMNNGQAVSVLVKMFCVFSRALQELQIRFQPSPSVKQEIMAGSINTTTSHGDNTLLDGLSDVSFSATDRSVASTDTEPPRIDPASLFSPHRDPQTPSAETSSFTSESTHSSGQPYLMTPESLMNSSRSPTKTTTPQNLLQDSTASSSSSFTHITGTNVSVDDLLSSCGTSEMNALAATPDSSVTLTPTPSSAPSNQVSPLVGKPSPVGGSHLPKTYDQIKEDDDEGPKSPPPSPVGGDIQDLQGDQLLESSENVAELLQKSARIKEKRISDSSAEVAQILGANIEGEEAEEEEEELEDDVIEQEVNDGDDDDGHDSPVTMDTGKADVDADQDENRSFVAQETNTQDQKKTEGLVQSARTDLMDDGDDDSQAVSAGSEMREEERGSVQSPGGPVVLPLEDQVSRNETSSPDGMYRTSVPVNQQDLGQIMGSLEQMMSLLQTQQQEIKHLRQEMNKAQLSNSIIQSTKARIDKLEKGLGTKLDTMFTKQSEQERQRLTLALQEKTNLDKQKQERLLETVSQTLKQQVTSRLDKTVRLEIESKVIPELHKVLVPVTEQLNTSIAQKLTATDQLMKENIHKLVKSKGVAETMGQAAAHALSDTIQSTYRDAFHSTVVPAFERACSSMFQQINTIFDAGTREYVNQLEANLAKMKQKQREGQEPVLKELKAVVETQRTSAEDLKSSIFTNVQGEISEQLHTTTEKLKKEMLERVQIIVQEEIGTALKDQQTSLQQDVMAAIRSQAATPVPQAQDIQHIQAKIRQLIEQKHINAAFQHALNAADLRVVVFTCHEVTPDTIFSDDGCLLEQPVLLSLLQQLSQDLGSQTKIKCIYIDEALLAVDTTFPVTREHLSGVITELRRQVTMVLQTQPNHPQTKQLKRVLMQAQSLK
ncbi:enhancer of mRNA-decapping protein 4 isoform X2 [Strongylocentrotus purpuratus]|uniref:Enhancer of mRNA-decapping protein 4 n=1 Tax=Strongylocentrotus purpuratus TaxID=7668 RepID=A0A7M7N4D2_STRPU|nr:enhancer of mRNA-decapping protein 4 isoform X2 [Strongylocentrotus purpuratus]